LRSGGVLGFAPARVIVQIILALVDPNRINYYQLDSNHPTKPEHLYRDKLVSFLFLSTLTQSITK
jgi:hypothetical protein